MAIIAGLLVAAGLPSGDARAAIDVAAKVRVELVARPGSASGAAQDFVVRDGGVLRSGDGVQLRLQSEADAYVYIVAYGSSNTAMLLRPFSARPGDALIRAGQRDVIPKAGVFLPLDDQEGRETLFTIVSDVPLTSISDLLPRMEAQGDDLTAITALIKATYPQASRLSFKHIGASPLVGVAAATPRVSPSAQTQSPAAELQASDGDPNRLAGASLLPPAGSGWSLPSSEGFGTSEVTPTGAVTAIESTPGPGAAGNVQAGAAASEAASAPVSSALRKAREAAGIDEGRFRGILASLPDSGSADAPESIRTPYKEQGVLSAKGDRIRALERTRLESGASWPSDDHSQNSIQN
ncbi:MAG: hypothetical protein BMS9Abin01_1719 [Gammaproteobacteria bacterium]|nr:MAG: hypothetical protein BMS9Abin01_1719 [Gammaproteobacteria bacterium]